MVVLAGTSGAVVVAVVGVPAVVFWISGIGKYGGFTGSGQPRAREMGRAEYDEDSGSSEQIYNRMGSVDGDVDQSGAFMPVGISCHNVCPAISRVCSWDRAGSSEGRDEGRAGQFREMAGDTALFSSGSVGASFVDSSRVAVSDRASGMSQLHPLFFCRLSRDVTPVTSPGRGRAAHLRAVPRRGHVE